MSVRLIIDSASDFGCEKAKEKGITVVPMTVCFGEELYKDGVELDQDAFFDKLIESDVMPTTAQPSPAEFISAIEGILADGDTPLIITISSELSGTYQSACIAASSFDSEVFVVDSRNATLGEAILVEYALRLIDKGLCAEEIVSLLNEKKNKINLLGLLDTLEYLKKGGRISSTAALAGSLLSIKPVVSVDEGIVKLVGKARGSKNGNNLLAELISRCGEIDFDMPFTLAFSGKDDSILKKYVEDSKHFWEDHTDELPVIKIGSTIGTHVGPGAIAVAFFSK